MPLHVSKSSPIMRTQPHCTECWNTDLISRVAELWLSGSHENEVRYNTLLGRHITEGRMEAT